ncbi:hypothetical protein ACS0TY_009198 [Phlomoides rotata]
MATPEVEVERSDVRLKRLGFVKILAINAVVLVSNLYDYAKRNSGPLKSTVGKVEHAVTSVVGPVYSKFNQVPTDILLFLDGKVDEAWCVFGERAPSVVSMVEKASEEGPVAAISHAGKISKEFTVSQLVKVFYKANQYSFVHGVVEVSIPTATHLLNKYNSLVKDLTGKGWCSVFSYVPLVPVEEMEKAYKQVEAAASKKKPAGSSQSGSDSDKE